MPVFRLVPRPLLLLATLLISVAIVLTGCGTQRGAGPHDDPAVFVPDRWPGSNGALSTIREGCDILEGPAEPGGEFVFALTEEVSPEHAPVPHNASERVVFTQLYETLVNVACDGTVTAGLAQQWTCTEDSTTWVFTIRDGARFWDGTRVTAEDVRLAWSDNQNSPAKRCGTSPWSWINAGASSITAVDTRRLAIQLPEAQASFPLLLAHPAAAVTRHQPGWTWPVGTGPCRLRASDPAPQPELVCRPNLNHPRPPVWKTLVFRISPGTDPRDLVASDLDLALARNLDTVGFFEDVPGFRAVPLPWDKLYLLVCPPETNPAGPAQWTNATSGLNVARDLTGVSARDWDHIMFPVNGGAICPQLSGPITRQAAVSLDSKLAQHKLDARTIAYPADDAGAAELAGRLSHLAGTGRRSAGLGMDDLNFALQWQMAGAFIIAQDQIFPTGCLQMAALLGRAAWLQKLGLDQPEPVAGENLAQADQLSARSLLPPAEILGRAGVVHPLALTRSWLITRGELAGLRLDFDGTPLLSGLGRSAAPEVTP